jgi:hypothetical protein
MEMTCSSEMSVGLSELHDVISQKIGLFITTTVRTSDFAGNILNISASEIYHLRVTTNMVGISNQSHVSDANFFRTLEESDDCRF